ncbi:YcxB family protein [Mucilaginibacter flavidus]|uniref:YcxB family protein n=1 Tax=Mucilaginibacter flavidus TaxID=2949309 RepID=UPI0020931472|nr:YcxB family protein [Mucilaginibacter flavidus]MCO5946141.1 YcxB family protein [Mucilaginibacter flavidus]
MEDITINSLIDIKTYFNISLLVQYNTRAVVRMLIIFALVHFCMFYSNPFNWADEILIIVMYTLFYAGVFPLLTYIGARRNMAKTISLREPKVYTISNEQIALKGETVSSTITWPHIIKFIEREKYFILMPSGRAFYYLPKSGFQSDEDIARLKNLVKEKGIKMSYH